MISTLPPALAPWAPWLRMFPADLALSLGPLVQRLSAALGPFPTPASSGGGEPDGFSGLTRRGDYERLLVSEWSLAELMPDEFLRRAAASEHAFLKLERREPARARASVVLFDAGPAQLGGPRIAHLAALIALAHRADVVHASLAWGVLQQPDAALVTATTRETLRALLTRRTASPSTPEHWAAWRARVDAESWQDLWLVGGPAPALRWPRTTRHLEIHEPITAGPPTLEVTVRTSGRTTRLALTLPDGSTCVRLIRDPVHHERAPSTHTGERPTKLVPDSELVITALGDHVFARARGGGVIVYAVPHSAKGGVGRPKLRFKEARSTAAAVTWHNRGAAALFLDRDNPAILHHRSDRRATGDDRTYYPQHPASIVAPPQLRPLVLRKDRALLHDGADHLLRLTTIDHGKATVQIVEPQVMALAEAPRWFAYIAAVPRGREQRPCWHLVIDDETRSLRTTLIAESRPHAAFFAHHTTHGCIAAIALDGERWQIHGMGDTPSERRTTDHVIGLLSEPRCSADHGPALIALGHDQRTFFAHQSASTTRLTVADAPVLHAVTSTVTDHLAYLTADHTVVVLKPPYDAPLARFTVRPPR